jgi:heme exporter protein B
MNRGAGSGPVWAAILWREARGGWRGGGWMPFAYFLLVALMVPFAVGPDAALLRRIAPGILWIAALAAALLPVERLVEPDRAAGWLDQYRVAGHDEIAVALAKTLGHWLGFAPMLLVAAGLGAVMLGLDAGGTARLLAALGIGSAALAALAVAAAALTAGMDRAGALAPLLVLPAAVPLLIFGAAASTADPGAAGALMLEASAALLVMVGAPLASAAALRALRS